MNVKKCRNCNCHISGYQTKKKNDLPEHLQFAFQKAKARALDYHSKGELLSVQAVVLAAGTGSRMITLGTDTSIHKCLLPIATVPMLYFPLRMLQRSGFSECIVVVSSGCEEMVQAMAIKYGLTIKLDIHTVDQNEDPGTLDSLRQIAGSLEDYLRDVIIVSGDIVSNINLADMHLTHVMSEAALTLLTAKLEPEVFCCTPGLKQKSSIGPDIIMENLKDKVVCRIMCGGDYEDLIEVPDCLMTGSLLTVTDTVDGHLYMCRTKLLKDYVLSRKSPCAKMTSLRAEAVPHLVDQQYRADRSEEYLAASKLLCEPFYALMKEMQNIEGVLPRDAPDRDRSCRSYHLKTGFYLRANTIPAYWHLNRQIPERLAEFCPDLPVRVGDRASSAVAPTAAIRGDSMVGAGCTIGDRCTITDSSIGLNCTLAPGCRVTNSLLMNNVTLGPGCVIENSLVCCSINKQKCTIKNCVVASDRTLENNQTVVGDTLEATQFFST